MPTMQTGISTPPLASNSAAQDALSAAPSLLPTSKASFQGGPDPAGDMFSVLTQYEKGVQTEAGEDRKLADPGATKKQIRSILDAARRTDARGMIAALGAIQPLGESLVPVEAGKAAWRGAVSDARRMWQSVERAGSSSKVMPASSGNKGMSLGFPDVCKAPAPPAPFVPIPYPNLAGLDFSNPDLKTKIPLPSNAPSQEDAANAQESASDAAAAAQAAADQAMEDAKAAAKAAADEAKKAAEETGQNAQDTGQNVVNEVTSWFP